MPPGYFSGIALSERGCLLFPTNFSFSSNAICPDIQIILLALERSTAMALQKATFIPIALLKGMLSFCINYLRSLKGIAKSYLPSPLAGEGHGEGCLLIPFSLELFITYLITRIKCMLHASFPQPLHPHPFPPTSRRRGFPSFAISSKTVFIKLLAIFI